MTGPMEHRAGCGTGSAGGHGVTGFLGVTEAPELVDNPLPVICHGTSLVLDGWVLSASPGYRAVSGRERG
jgi:hypothetical protein